MRTKRWAVAGQAIVLATGIAAFGQGEGDDGTGVGVTTVHVPREEPKQVAPPQDNSQVDAGNLPVHEVQSGPLTVTVVGRGNLKSTNTLEARSEIEGQATIMMILPEGTKVVKDQLVCELDSAALRDNLADQQIATERAHAHYQNAIKAREVAEVEVHCFKEGTFPHEEKSLQGEIELAAAELELARDRLAMIEDVQERGLGSVVSVKEAQVASLRADLALRKAERALEVFRNYTYERRIKTLEGEVEKAKADELAEKSAFELEKEKEEKLRRMIEKCKIYAPGNGIVFYGNPEWPGGPTASQPIAEGATVRERQTLFYLPDLDNIQIEAKIPELMIDRVRPGMPARIRVDAFPNSDLSGEAVEVKPLPAP